MSEEELVRAEVKTRDGDTLIARLLRRGDETALQEFDRSLSDRSRDLFAPHAYDDATVARMVKRAEEGQDLTYILLGSNSQAVGYFFLWHCNDPAPLLGIGIHDAHHGQGIGRKLMEILIEDARNSGRDGIDLTTMQDNASAYHLYESLGFEYTGDVDNVTGDGRHVIERAMFLPLKPGATPPDRQHGPPA